MTRVLGYRVLVGLVGLVLSACQSMDAMRMIQTDKKQHNRNTVQVYCAGAEICEFGRLNGLIIVDEKSHRVTSEAMKKAYVRQMADRPDQKGTYLTIPAQQYEMVIRFYPISQQHAEVFHIIHNFKENQRYTFKMYRQRSRDSGSLLNVSAPNPLCVDMLQEQRTIRRFCRPYNVVTGVSEFIEQKI
ncbi:hypothetical protein [Acinetobacter sp. WZC-1]|uniref:hypothetical protein n=1 Tax=Acinetobacter sp. WZC-1 TaxID=3459034 RepID=UPI00403DF96E